MMAFRPQADVLIVGFYPSSADYPDEVLSEIAPIGHKHINLRGILTFDLTQYAPSLLDRAAFVGRNRASSSKS